MNNTYNAEITRRLLHIGYLVSVAISIPLSVYCVIDEIITFFAIANGHYNFLNQITALSNTQANIYTLISFMTFLVLTIFGIYYVVKKKQSNAMLIFFLVWAVFFVEWMLENLYKTLG